MNKKNVGKCLYIIGICLMFCSLILLKFDFDFLFVMLILIFSILLMLPDYLIFIKEVYSDYDFFWWGKFIALILILIGLIIGFILEIKKRSML